MGTASQSPLPPMAHPTASYQPFTGLTRSPFVYSDWQQPALARPPALAPAVHRGGLQPGLSPPHRIPSNAQSSISSATSGSSDTSDHNRKIASLPPHSRSTSHSDREQPFELSTGGSSRAISGTTGRLTNWPEADESRPVVIQYVPPDEDAGDEDRDDHALWILCWLLCLDPFHSLFSCVFSVFAFVGLILLCPLRLCRKGDPFGSVLVRTLAPVFRNHLRQIYAPSAKHAHEFDFSALRLMLVHLALPVVSLAMAFFACVAAVFWLFALAMGNPDGTEKRDDGRATVLGARNYLERYLLGALRD